MNEKAMYQISNECKSLDDQDSGLISFQKCLRMCQSVPGIGLPKLVVSFVFAFMLLVSCSCVYRYEKWMTRYDELGLVSNEYVANQLFLDDVNCAQVTLFMVEIASNYRDLSRDNPSEKMFFGETGNWVDVRVMALVSQGQLELISHVISGDYMAAWLQYEDLKEELISHGASSDFIRYYDPSFEYCAVGCFMMAHKNCSATPALNRIIGNQDERARFVSFLSTLKGSKCLRAFAEGCLELIDVFCPEG